MDEAAGFFSGITKRYTRRGSWVLRGIDLELQPGSRTLIVGGNGSGKSTLLRIGAGVSWPNSGTVTLPDCVGYVPERLPARTKFTGVEYLCHMGRIKGLHRGVISTRGRELLERLDLQPSPNVPIESLSKGNRQKLVLAQAFLSPVGLLVLDEPFSGLDPVARAALAELTSEAQSGGTAVLVSSHHTLPEEAGLRQLRIHDGILAEIRHRDAPVAASERCMEVELVPTERVVDREQLGFLPGDSSVQQRQSPGVVVLLTDQEHIDRLLTAAIAQGWSVRSVREESREGSIE